MTPPVPASFMSRILILMMTRNWSLIQSWSKVRVAAVCGNPDLIEVQLLLVDTYKSRLRESENSYYR